MTSDDLRSRAEASGDAALPVALDIAEIMRMEAGDEPEMRARVLASAAAIERTVELALERVELEKLFVEAFSRKHPGYVAYERQAAEIYGIAEKAVERWRQESSDE